MKFQARNYVAVLWKASQNKFPPYFEDLELHLFASVAQLEEQQISLNSKILLSSSQ